MQESACESCTVDGDGSVNERFASWLPEPPRTVSWRRVATPAPVTSTETETFALKSIWSPNGGGITSIVPSGKLTGPESQWRVSLPSGMAQGNVQVAGLTTWVIDPSSAQSVPPSGSLYTP